ncbi:MAG: NAD-dependent epimerase/dehydratase family protein [Pseudomonadota bacterium]
MSKVLVTGMSGLIGTALRREIEGEHQLSALNRSSVAGVTTTRASLADLEAIRGAFEGQDIVVHLAAKISDSYGWDDLLATNVVGTRNVFEAAAQAGVKRIVFASSGATVAGWERVEPYRALVAGDYDRVPEHLPLIDETMPTRPANLYASTKVWGEAIARHYADSFDLSIVCLRIGWTSAEDRPTEPRHYAVWNSQRDVVSAFRLAMTADLEERFETLFVLSNNHRGYRNIDRARRLLGFEPADSAEDYRN